MHFAQRGIWGAQFRGFMRMLLLRSLYPERKDPVAHLLSPSRYRKAKALDKAPRQNPEHAVLDQVAGQCWAQIETV